MPRRPDHPEHMHDNHDIHARPGRAPRGSWPRGPRIGAFVALALAVAFAVGSVVRPDLLAPRALRGQAAVAMAGSASTAPAPASPASSGAVDDGAADAVAMPSPAVGGRAVLATGSGRLLERYVQAVTPGGGDVGLPCASRSAPAMLRNGVLRVAGGDGCAPAIAWSRALFP